MTLHLSKQIVATRINRIKRYLTLSMTLAFLSEVVGFNSWSDVLIGTLIIAIWAGYYALLFRSLKKILYSFLTFLAIGIVLNTFFLISKTTNQDYPSAVIYLVNLLVFIVIAFNMNRPIFYPKINWTEYDFRHRKDKRVKIKINEEESFSARLYDKRRGEAALLCFQELNVDDEYEIFDENETLLLKARVLSQRKALLGRPVAHGIKII